MNCQDVYEDVVISMHLATNDCTEVMSKVNMVLWSTADLISALLVVPTAVIAPLREHN